jgi:hypothetical protein
MNNIKFKKHYVTNGTIKARIRYSLDNRIDGRKCVTLYAKDWDTDWSMAFGCAFSDTYKNDTDSMTDYFDQGRVCLFEDHPLYAIAREAAENKLRVA